MEKQILTPKEKIQEFLNLLNKFGFKYKYNGKYAVIKIKGHIGFIGGYGDGYDFYQGKYKGISIMDSDNSEVRKLRLFNEFNGQFETIEIPKHTYIQFYKEYLSIEFY